MSSFQSPQAFTAGNAGYVAEINRQILTSKNKKEYKLQGTKILCKTHLTQRIVTCAEKKKEAAFSSPKKKPVRLPQLNHQYAF
jgi:hypothetical protein